MIDGLTKYNKNTSKSGVILKPNGPAAQDMIVLMRRLLYLSFSSLPTVQLTAFAVITLLWCLLWVQSLPLSLLSSFLLCVLCVLRVSWLWWTSLPTVGLTARGAPLWPLCVSADQGRAGGGCGWGWAGLGLEGLDCSDDDNECYGFFSFLQA